MAKAGPPTKLGKPTSIEEQVRNAYFTPTPVEYNPLKAPKGGTLTKISEARVASALDHEAKQKSFVPGPGSYETPDVRDFALPEGGRLNRIPPQEKNVTLDEYPKPPPGHYGIPIDPTLPRQLYGAFGKDPRVTKFIEEEVKRSRQVPAPGEHEVLESMESVKPFCPEGGRYLDQAGRGGYDGPGTGYFDHAAKMADGKPGPDRYSLPGAIRTNKSAGKLVWKYQSESLADTKKIITKVCGDGHENPPPGHYTLPDPAPLTTAPVLKGKMGPAMPHPFAYNCAPDHARKFAPLLEQNSGEQIYGNGSRPGSQGSIGIETGSRATKAKESADAVAAMNMPKVLAERDFDGPKESVNWRSGGFAALKRVKSAPVIKKWEHPVVVEFKQAYPSLSRHHGRHDKTFLPNAARRPEIVKTHKKSNEYETLQRKKWQLGTINAQLQAITAATLDTLDEPKMRDIATRGLLDKAKFRLRMEGMAEYQQDLVLAELPGVLYETASVAPSAFASAANSVREPMGEPLCADSRDYVF